MACFWLEKENEKAPTLKWFVSRLAVRRHIGYSILEEVKVTDKNFNSGHQWICADHVAMCTGT